MILETIAAAARRRVAAQKKEKSPEAVQRAALALPNDRPFAFEQALTGKNIAFICEVKKASPSKGIIAPDFPYAEIARSYETAGAAAISVLTEPEFFLGDDQYLAEISRAVSVPVLRKDFTVDEYQIYEAKCLGAAAVLLICALLDAARLRRFIRIADSLGLSALVEAHDETEIKKALDAGARVIGVNNRNLKDFSVDVQNSLRLRALVPADRIFVSESGLKSRADIEALENAHVQAALIGETFMRSPNKTAALAKLYGQTRQTRLKICGLTRMDDVEAVNQSKADYAGFVFAKSRRRVTARQAKELKAALNPAIQAVGVFVNAPDDEIAAVCQDGTIDIIQLHGDESDDDIRRIQQLTGKPVIKAWRVQSPADIETARTFSADYLLFDAFSAESYGGAGNTFDWRVLEDFPAPFFLAGGISLRNAAAAIHRLAPFALDLSSGVETDGKKDAEKIREIARLVKAATSKATDKIKP